MNSQSPKRSFNIPFPIWALALSAVILGGVGYYRLHYLPRVEAEKTSAIEKAGADVENFFANWSASTIEDDKVLIWSGRQSKIQYVDYSPAWTDRYGTNYNPSWTVWAKTESGRLFIVSFYLDKTYRLKPETTPRYVSQTDLAKLLVNRQRLDLVQKLGLPTGKA